MNEMLWTSVDTYFSSLLTLLVPGATYAIYPASSTL
jgi:hypothetical protein